MNKYKGIPRNVPEGVMGNITNPRRRGKSGDPYKPDLTTRLTSRFMDFAKDYKRKNF